MAASMGRGVCARCFNVQRSFLRITSPGTSSIILTQQSAAKTPPQLKWKKLRAQKVQRIDFESVEEEKRQSKLSPEKMRAEMKKKGLPPPRQYLERNITISSTTTLFEPYVPPEGDGIASPISGKGAKQRFTGLEKKGKSYMQLRKIRKYEDLDVKEFASDALDIYIRANQLLEDFSENKLKLHELATEKAVGEMAWNLDKRTFRWKYIEAIEPPRVVHVRTVDMMSKQNLYGQITVRLYTRQALAIYDRFGRLMYGGENLIKDVLEYVVFEKHLSDTLGLWRMHGKATPEWLPPRDTVLKTVKMPKFEEVEEDEGSGDEKSEEKKVAKSSA